MSESKEEDRETSPNCEGGSEAGFADLDNCEDEVGAMAQT